jgi:rod shape determining protein RodA
MDRMYFVEKTKGTNYLKQFDYPLLVAVIILSVIGLGALRSAIGSPEVTGTWLKQLICFFIGIVLAISISAIDYKDFKTLGIPVYIGSIALLVMVLIFGNVHAGSKSWLEIPFVGFSVQPSEFAKVAFTVVVPVFFERLKEGKDLGKNIFKLLIYAMLPIGLVFLQPDVGTALVFVFAFVVMLFIYGIPYRYFLMAFGAFAVSAPVLWFFVIPNKFPHIRKRIMTFIFPETDLSGAGMQVNNSKMAIGSGRLFGKGLFFGIQDQNIGSTSSYFVPERESDFIFSVIGEELGFVGSVLVIILVFFILYRCIYISMSARDYYGSYMAICVTSILAFHFIENIGMCIGIMPVTGIPLPFVSQGNSSLIANYMNIGVMLSISMRRKKTIFNSTQ